LRRRLSGKPGGILSFSSYVFAAARFAPPVKILDTLKKLRIIAVASTWDSTTRYPFLSCLTGSLKRLENPSRWKF
jgi:hypothetical protein